MQSELSSETIKLIDSYLHLPIGVGCSCPYFNNRRTKVRGGLSALVGKGTPEDIAIEVKIKSILRKVNTDSLDSTSLKKFLSENNLGIDCSGLAYHLLNVECISKGLGKLSSHIKIEANIIRKILYKLRPEINTSVEVLSSPENSVEIDLKDIKAGDFISILRTGAKKTYNHILVIKKVSDKTISYIHSYSWPSDGKYEHGVRNGEIHITDYSLPILKASWKENTQSDKNNYTFISASDAESVTIRRLKVFTKNT